MPAMPFWKVEKRRQKEQALARAFSTPLMALNLARLIVRGVHQHSARIPSSVLLSREEEVATTPERWPVKAQSACRGGPQSGYENIFRTICGDLRQSFLRQRGELTLAFTHQSCSTPGEAGDGCPSPGTLAPHACLSLTSCTTLQDVLHH